MDILIESFRGHLLGLAEIKLPLRLRSKFDAEDLVQDTITSALQSKDDLRGLEPYVVKKWLEVILLNNITNKYRTFHSKKRDVSRDINIQAELQQSNAGIEGWLIADQTSPSMAAARNEEVAEMLDSIAMLPERQRDVIIRKHIQRQTLEQIAVDTDQTIPGVAGLLRRAFATLRANRPPDSSMKNPAGEK